MKSFKDWNNLGWSEGVNRDKLNQELIDSINNLETTTTDEGHVLIGYEAVLEVIERIICG